MGYSLFGPIEPFVVINSSQLHHLTVIEPAVFGCLCSPSAHAGLPQLFTSGHKSWHGCRAYSASLISGWNRRFHNNCSLECPIYANKRPHSDEANGERPRLHNITLNEPEAWHENKPEIMLLMDGGYGPAAAIYLTATLINSYPVTWALTGMNNLTWQWWWWQCSCAYVWPTNGGDKLTGTCVHARE